MRHRHTFAICVLCYVGITLAYSWPLILHVADGVAHDLGDPLLNTWILWWSGTQAVPLTASWWNAPTFFPATGVLAFSEHLLGLAPLAAPIIGAFHSPLAGYNITLLATYVLSATGAHVLAFTITRRHDASFVAALAFAFAPYRVAQLPHIQVLSSYASPLCLAALHRYHSEGRRRWSALAAVAWLLQALSCGYYFFFLSVLVVLWLAWFAFGRWSARQLALVAVPFAIAFALYLPFLLGYQHILRDTYDFHRGIGEIRAFSADAASLLQASPELLLWGWVRATDKPEAQLFPGLTLVVLAAFAFVRRSRLSVGADTPRVRKVRWVLGGLTILLGIGAIIPLVLGSWQLRIGALRLVSIARADKPLTLTMVVALAWAVTLPSVRSRFAHRSPTVFYALAAFIIWVFALGPDPQIFGRRLLYQAPYGWLMRLPGFDGLRVPARFWMMAVVCLSVVAAAAINGFHGRARRVVLTLASIGLLLDGWPREFVVLPAPSLRPVPPGVVTRVEIPMNDGRDPLAVYQQMFDHVPLYNGFSGYGAPHQFAMREMLNAQDPRIFEALALRGPMGVIVDHKADTDGAARRFMRAYPGVVVTHDEPDWSSYKVPRRSAVEPPDAGGLPLRIASVEATPGAEQATRAIDGDLSTHWNGGVQRGFGEFVVRLEQPSRVSQLVVSLGEFMTDFPQRLRIEVSPNGQTWETVFSGDTILQAYYAAVRHPREIPLVFPIDRDSVRVIRLRQSGWGTHNWTIAEISARQ